MIPLRRPSFLDRTDAPAPVPRVTCPRASCLEPKDRTDALSLVPRAKGWDKHAYPRASHRVSRVSRRAPSLAPRASRRAMIHPLTIHPPVDHGV